MINVESENLKIDLKKSTLSYKKENYFVILYINHIAEKFIQYFKNFKVGFSMGLIN